MKYEKIVQEYRDERSMELYGKPESQLMISEVMNLNKYIHDYENPVWKPIIIDGKETNYFIDNIGNVYSNKQRPMNKIKPSKSQDGYLRIKLYINDKKISMAIQRLVAFTFIPNIENKPQVNHISGIKTCNWVGNLEWVTCKENVHHGYDHNLMHPAKGSKNGNSIYNEEQVHKICKYLEEGKSQLEISLIMNIPRYIIFNIQHHRTWVHISKLYNFNKNKKQIN